MDMHIPAIHLRFPEIAIALIHASPSARTTAGNVTAAAVLICIVYHPPVYLTLIVIMRAEDMSQPMTDTIPTPFREVPIIKVNMSVTVTIKLTMSELAITEVTVKMPANIEAIMNTNVMVLHTNVAMSL
jgi:hypothetical protein